MDQILQHIITVFMAFFAIMNPIWNTAAFIGLVGSRSKAEQKLIAARGLIIAFCILLFFSILGKIIFELFGITLNALRMAGGILVFIIGYNMLQGKSSDLHDADGNSNNDVTAYPLATPLLAGPGTIATAMNYSAGGGWTSIAITVGIALLLCVITFLCFISASRIIRVIGQSGLDIVTRLMGLILAVIGMQMFIIGTKAAFF